MCLSSLVTAIVHTGEVCPCKTVSCLLSKRFQILIVLSQEPEIIYLLSLVTAKLHTESVCPCKSASILFSKRFQILIVLS